MSKDREEGIAGFFEDIPVLIVITIATGIFLFSLVHAYVAYLDQLEHQRMHENAQRFCKSIRSYSDIIYTSEEGVFLGEKITSLTIEALEEDFSTRELGYEYQVSIIDTSDYPNSVNYTRSYRTSNPMHTASRYSVTTSVLIKEDDCYHAAQLIITIWRQ
ncbi:MAG: hypothetical protein JSV56_10520 [Methanomassiliicoccales archaeon]|nr:MAG: hypothetical protein JSV56_10520 [Methanomassiliicoccales archaeon]